MDPLSAIGLVSSVITFIDFGYKVISAAREVHASATGTTAANDHLEYLNTRMEAVAQGLRVTKPSEGGISADERRLTELADKCLELSNELKQFLDKLRANNPKSKRQVIRAIVQNIMKKDKRKDLEARLDQCHQQLHLQLSHTTRLESLDRLTEIARTGKCHEKELGSLKHQMEILKDAVASLNPNSKLQDDARTILNLSDLAVSKVLQNNILEALRFEGMETRLDNIEEAHAETFKWLLTDETSSSLNISTAKPNDPWFTDIADFLEKGSSLRRGIREQFTNWLAHGDGIFHISGKPGAGKSTLMKYLTESKEIKRYLDTWTGQKQLTFASFFFWMHGTDFQRSLKGLLRSLLYSVLDQHQDLARMVFPTQWEAANKSPRKALHFSQSEIQEAFNILMRTPEVYLRHKFVFFIDGLDEFEGEDVTLVKTLFEWAHSGSENIKICVSSRESPIFEQRFSKCLKFRLHEATYLDIFLFVYDTLRNNEDVRGMHDPQDVVRLGRTLVERAEGVFLWVSMALRLMEHGLALEKSIEELERSIEVLPRELAALFRVIFNSIETEQDPIDRRKAMRTLSLVLDGIRIPELAARGGGRLFLTRLSFMNDYESGDKKATARDTRLSRCRKQLIGGCRGLLTIQSQVDVAVVRKEWVELTHRSLIEFFQLPDIQACIEGHCKGFNKLHFYCRSLIDELKVWSLSQGKYLTRLKYDELRTFQASSPNSPTPSKSELLYGRLWIVHDLRRLINLYYWTEDRDISTLVSTIYELRKLIEADAKSIWEFETEYLDMWEFQGTGRGSSKSLRVNQVRCCIEACVILTALQFGVYEVWPTYTPDNNLRQTILHLVTNSLTHPWPGVDMEIHSSEGTFNRLLRTLATCLADGTPANSLMPVDECFVAVSVWQSLVWDCIMSTEKSQLRSAAPMWLLFLLHGAARDFTLSFEPSCNFSATSHRGKLVLVTGQWGPEKFQVHSPMYISGGEGEDNREDSDDGNILELARGHNWSVSLKELTYFWFPSYADSFRKIYDLYESSVDIQMERLSDLRRELGFDPECWQTQRRNDPRPLQQCSWEGTSRIVERLVYDE